MRIRSLTARVLLLATLWSALGLVTIAVAISALYRQGVERGFNNLLRAQLYNVVNSVSIGDGDSLAGSPALGDLRFSQPATGWYWLVEPLGNYATAPLASASLGVANLAVPDVELTPFDQNYERYYEMGDELGNQIRIAETEVVLDDQGRELNVTVSIGIAMTHGPKDTAAKLLERADQGLYRAKRDGRNRVAAEAA